MFQIIISDNFYNLKRKIYQSFHWGVIHYIKNNILTEDREIPSWRQRFRILWKSCTLLIYWTREGDMRKRENIWMISTTDYLQMEVDSMNCKKTVVENQDKPVKITINVSFLLAKISKTLYCFIIGKGFL